MKFPVFQDRVEPCQEYGGRAGDRLEAKHSKIRVPPWSRVPWRGPGWPPCAIAADTARRCGPGSAWRSAPSTRWTLPPSPSAAGPATRHVRHDQTIHCTASLSVAHPITIRLAEISGGSDLGTNGSWPWVPAPRTERESRYRFSHCRFSVPISVPRAGLGIR